MVFLYLSKPHCIPHHLCFTNSRFHQTTTRRYFHASKFTSQRAVQHLCLQLIIRFVAVFFISGTPVHISWNIVPHHLEHCSMLTGTTFHLSDTTPFYLKRHLKEWKNIKPNLIKRKSRGNESQT